MMNDSLRQDVIVLGGGLDLTTAKTVTPKGSLIDGLNYEVVDLSGYRRIDGFVPFDGSVIGDATSWFEIVDDSFVGDMSSTFPVGSYISVSGNSYPFGIVVALDNVTKAISYVRMSIEDEPEAGDEIIITGGSSTGFLTDDSPEEGTGATAKDTVNNLNTYNQTIRGVSEGLPSQVLGLHWFRDKLYSFSDSEVYQFTDGNEEIYPGDHLSVEISAVTRNYIVAGITVNSGTWGAGTASGYVILQPLGRYSRRALLSVVGATLKRPETADVDDAITLTVLNPSGVESVVGMFRSRSEAQSVAEGDPATDSGWYSIDTGWIINYEDGAMQEGSFPVIDRRTGLPEQPITEGTTSAGLFEMADTSISYPGDNATVGTNVSYWVSAAGGASDPTKYVTAISAADSDFISFNSPNTSEGITKKTTRIHLSLLSNASEVPQASSIRGVTLELTNVIVSPNSTVRLYMQLFDAETNTLLGEEKMVEFVNSTASPVTTATTVVGSDTDTWGIRKYDIRKVREGDIGLSFYAVETNTATPGSLPVPRNLYLTIDQIELEWDYSTAYSKLFFWDGVDYVQADLLSYRESDGNLLSGNSEGIMQIANVEPYAPNHPMDTPYPNAVRRVIYPGDEIHIKPDGGSASPVGVVVAHPSGYAMKRNAPANLNDVLENDSRYQFVTANFWANEEFDSIYGVTGAGRAFSFDGTYFVTIYTQDDETKDMPRHIEFYHNHLALGFRSGSVQMSVVGEPENFDGFQGASEIGIGDKITGLLTMRGTQLGVFCENSIWTITGTTVDNFSTSVLAPKTGALEYTVLDIGIPVYADSRGISTISQSEKYGDFMGQRMSQQVTPWISKRLLKNRNLFSVVNGAGVTCAVPVRSKNQYRLFFRDGYVLTMTLNNIEQTPTFTFQRYYVGQSSLSETTKFFVPFSWSSQVDDDGKERIHMSHYSSLSSADIGVSRSVYEFDRGWSFNGNFIPAYFVTNWNWVENPFEDNTIRKVRADGLSHGYSNVRISTAKDYNLDFGNVPQNISIPRTTASTFYQDVIPVTSIANVAERGRTLAIKLENHIASDGTITSAEPSHIYQVLLVQFTGGKQDV